MRSLIRSTILPTTSAAAGRAAESPRSVNRTPDATRFGRERNLRSTVGGFGITVGASVFEREIARIDLDIVAVPGLAHQLADHRVRPIAAQPAADLRPGAFEGDG